MADHWREKLVQILEKNCLGMDDHDGAGALNRPLLERCVKCRDMKKDQVDLIKEVRDLYPGLVEREDLKDQIESLQSGLLKALEGTQAANAGISARLLDLLAKRMAP